MKKRGPHPYSLACSCTGANTLHVKDRHGSGETMLRCTKCGTWKTLQRQRAVASNVQLKSNPSARTDVAKAVRLYEGFTGEAGDEIARVNLPNTPKVGLAIGKVLLIGYETVRDGVTENYVHRFAAHARPLLVSSHDGRSVFMLGGAYTFTNRGIVDKKRRAS